MGDHLDLIGVCIEKLSRVRLAALKDHGGYADGETFQILLDQVRRDVEGELHSHTPVMLGDILDRTTLLATLPTSDALQKLFKIVVEGIGHVGGFKIFMFEDKAEHRDSSFDLLAARFPESLKQKYQEWMRGDYEIKEFYIGPEEIQDEFLPALQKVIEDMRDGKIRDAGEDDFRFSQYIRLQPWLAEAKERGYLISFLLIIDEEHPPDSCDTG